MKALLFFPLGHRRCIIRIVNALLATGLTVISFRSVQPKECYRECGIPEGMPCLRGGYRYGEQKIGWTLPVFVDNPSGGSLTNGWGLLGPVKGDWFLTDETQARQFAESLGLEVHGSVA